MTEEPLKVGDVIKLPKPDTKGILPLESALQARRSVRSFKRTPLTIEQKGQLLWAGQGITRDGYFRTAPSAGALYPLTLYLSDESAIYRYEPAGHQLVVVRTGDFRSKLSAAALGQDSVANAPIVIAIAGQEDVTAGKYGQRAGRYMFIEAGHAGQNILLQAVSLGLGAVPVGAFRDDDVLKVLDLPKSYTPLYLIPVGVPR